MVALRSGTAEYDALFGSASSGELEEFKSKLPTHQQLQVAWLDPSVREGIGVDNYEKIFAKQTMDLQRGSRGMLWNLTADLSAQGMSMANMPTELLRGVKSVIESTPIMSVLSELETVATFDASDAGGAAKHLGTVALGVGLAAVGTSVPIVGQIGAVVVALGKAIHSIIHRQKAKLEEADAAHRAALYESFPPLQTADSTTDSGLVDNQLRPILQTQDWTKIFLPRFQGEWVGIERDEGFAFAPGEKDSWDDEFGGDKGEAFVPSGGVGLIPGTSILTSVIQVNLNPRGQAFKTFVNNVAYDPRGRVTAFNPLAGSKYIIDTGTFYPATARLAALAWEWATRPRSPFLYRLDCVRMHEAWRHYCESGIDYIKERVFPWYRKMNKEGGGVREENLEGFFGAAVYYGVGSWACMLNGGTTLQPKYHKFDIPYGRNRERMAEPNLYRFSEHAGAFLPILDEPSDAFVNCMGTMYHRDPAIRDTLNKLQARQRHGLRSSVVCAYVRRTDAAFAGDPDLRDLLDKMRSTLLTHEARFSVNILDVPEGERHNGKDWREQLLAAGVPKHYSKHQIGGNKRAGLETKDDEPEPEMPPLLVANPVPPAWRPEPEVATVDVSKLGGESAGSGVRATLTRWARERPVAAGAAGFGALFAAGWAMSKVYRRKSGPL